MAQANAKIHQLQDCQIKHDNISNQDIQELLKQMCGEVRELDGVVTAL